MIENEQLRDKVQGLPELPGVYLFRDKEGTVIYVGKAKRLKRRVTSYFSKSHDSAKLRILVRQITDLSHLVVETESDALLLENNLIKKYQPRYNVLLKDDKSFPWICLKNESFPRVFSTRNPTKDGSEYFGPYTSGRMMHAVLELVRQLYKPRTCRLDLLPANIEAGKFKVCLEYHIGNCLAPCVGKQSEKDYLEKVDEIRRILKGNISSLMAFLKEKMAAAAEALEFEQAQAYKERLQLLENYRSKSAIVNPKIHNVDVFSIVEGQERAYVNYLRVVDGAIIQAHTVEIQIRLDETIEEVLPTAIFELRQRFASQSPEIIVPFELDYPVADARAIVPKIGDKKTLLDLSTRNAKYFKLERERQREKAKTDTAAERIMATLQKDLRMAEKPVHIECFDNSNFQGSFPVSSCVVFKNAKPSKADYRHFNVKTVEGIDDFASMHEVVYRRYKRLLSKGVSFPQLIIIDGGKGQLGAAMQALDELGIRGQIAVIGIAKRLEEIYFPSDPVPLYLDKNSESLKLIQQLRNEAHRFGITFHRDQRSKALVRSQLASIKGVGDKTQEKLLTFFQSVEAIRQASLEQIAEQIGMAKAKVVFEGLRSAPPEPEED